MTENTAFCHIYVSTALRGEETADSDSAVKMYNKLISDIQASIMSTLSHPDPNNDQKQIPDKVIKWARELSYVTNLTQLNADKVFTLDNAEQDVATHLDLISFNLIDGKYADITYAENNDILGVYVDYIEDTLGFLKPNFIFLLVITFLYTMIAKGLWFLLQVELWSP